MPIHAFVQSCRTDPDLCRGGGFTCTSFTRGGGHGCWSYICTTAHGVSRMRWKSIDICLGVGWLVRHVVLAPRASFRAAVRRSIQIRATCCLRAVDTREAERWAVVCDRLRPAPRFDAKCSSSRSGTRPRTALTTVVSSGSTRRRPRCTLMCGCCTFATATRGVRPVLVTGGGSHTHTGVADVSARLSTVPFVGLGVLSSVITALWAYRRIVAHGFRPDLIHGNVYETAVATVLLGKLHRLPTVISEHSSRFPLGDMPRFALATARWSFKRADRVLPVSTFLRDAIAAYGVDARFQVIPKSSMWSCFSPQAEDRPRRIERLLFVGTLWPDDSKGLGVLLEALATLQSDQS